MIGNSMRAAGPREVAGADRVSPAIEVAARA